MSYIDKITNKDTGESRVISPAAEAVRVSNENYEGENLDEVLDEVAHAIEDAGSGDGTVTGVKIGSTTYEPTDGVVDLSSPMSNKVDKNGTDSLMTAAEHTKLGNLPTADQLATQMNAKANDNAVVKTISVNGGQAQTPQNGNVNISVQGAAGQDGITPHIGSNGHWWLGTTDTGINATGNDGQSITDADLVIRNALDGQGDVLGMSGAMRIKSNIDSLYTSLNRLYTKLANMAFWDATDQAAAAPTALDWSVPKKTVTLTLTLSNAVVKNNGQEVSSSVQVDEGSGLTLTVEPASGYALTGAPTVSTGATVTDNSNGTYSVAIASVDADMTLSITATAAAARSVRLNLTGCTKTSGPTSIIDGGGGTFVFAANDGYTLPTAAPTVNNATMASWDSSTGTLVISDVEGNVTITVTAIEQLTDGFYIFLGKSINQNGVPVTDAESCYTDFIELDQLSSSYTALWAYQLVADMSEDGAHLKEKRNLIFYDSNKRMLFMDSKWDAKRHPYSFTQNANNIRTLNTEQVSGILSAAGQNTPVYARISFGMSGGTIKNACGFTHNGRDYADRTKAHVASFSETVHDLTFNLTNCTTTATGNQDKVLSGQPVELLFSPSGSGSLNNFSVSATMGGVAVSPSNISISSYTDADGNSNYKKVVIENVTGDLVITASM